MMVTAVVDSEIERGKEYVVHSVFTNVINIQCESRLVALIDEYDFMGKGCVYISYPLKNVSKHVAPGDTFRLNTDSIAVGSQHIALQEVQIFDETKPQELLAKDSICFLTTHLEKILAGHAMGGDSLLHVSANTYPFSRQLRDALLSTREALSNGVLYTKYAGLGYGLTPCVDDYLCGILFTLTVLGERENVAPEFIEGVTSDVSFQMLMNATEGAFYDVFHRLIAAANLSDDNSLQEHSKKILDIGSSSGYYMLLGIKDTLETWKKKEE